MKNYPLRLIILISILVSLSTTLVFNLATFGLPTYGEELLEECINVDDVEYNPNCAGRVPKCGEKGTEASEGVCKFASGDSGGKIVCKGEKKVRGICPKNQYCCAPIPPKSCEKDLGGECRPESECPGGAYNTTPNDCTKPNVCCTLIRVGQCSPDENGYVDPACIEEVLPE